MPDPASPAPPVVLSFSVSDPSGAGGMQGDVMTLAGLGVYPLTVLCGVGAGDTAGLQEVLPVDEDFIDLQARALLEDVPVGAIKIGQPVTVEAVLVLAEILSDYPDVPVVLAPDLPTPGGDEMLHDALRAALAEVLLPLTTVLVASATELSAWGRAVDGDGGCAAEHLLAAGPRHVLLLGVPDGARDALDSLYGPRGLLRADRHPRSNNCRGRSATVAASMAAGLARGQAVDEACELALNKTRPAFEAPWQLGMGRAVPRRRCMGRRG